MDDDDITTDFIQAALAKRDADAASGDVSPFPAWQPQPDMLPPSGGGS